MGSYQNMPAALREAGLNPTYVSVLNEGRKFMDKKYPITMGISDISDWIIQRFLFDMVESGVDSACHSSSWTFNKQEDVSDWLRVEMAGYRKLASSHRSTYIWYGEDCLIDVYNSTSMLTFNMYGNPDKIEEVKKKINNSKFTNSRCTVTWIYARDGSSVTVPLRKREVIHSAYPWIQQGVESYVKEFLESNESVLILIGPPGTGKTSFIRNMILQAEASAQVSYDEDIMGSDALFAGWLDSRDQFIVLEDSDNFLKPRVEGNQMMHKFLNVSEGLITVSGKKMIFSTNLPKVSDIDDALKRKGRCFDVLEFRALEGVEIHDVLDEIGSNREVEEGRKYSLAELFAKSDEELVTSHKKTGFGFTN